MKMEDSEFEKYDLFFQTTQTHSFKTLIDSLKDIASDVVFNATKEGIYMETVDEAQVMIATFNLLSENFQRFFCRHRLELGLNLQGLFKLIKPLDTTDVLTMYVKRQDEEKLYIVIDSPKRGIQDNSYLRLLDFENNTFDISDDVQFNSTIKMPTSDFQKIVKDFNNVGDVLRIQTEYDKLILSVEGDIGQKMITIQSGIQNPPEDSGSTVVDINDYVKVDEHYSLHKIEKLIKCSNLCMMLLIQLKEGHPLVLTYKAGALGEVKFILCPFEQEDTT